ncbi:hypothetical protein [Desulfosediminicola sp.]|uniref:hypothetical protein n=1 Tax=Desulfosediminicola sp. TaxID=2886825 RepID=UPI003AF2D8C3
MKEDYRFQWRYHHFFSPPDIVFNIIEHNTDIFGLVASPYQTITGVVFDRKIRERKSLSQFTELSSPLNTPKKFTFKNGSIQADVSIQSKGEKHNEHETLVEHPTKKTANYWVVDHASSKAFVSLNVGDKIWNGNVDYYSDRQWGDLILQDFLDEWHWLHWSNDKHCIVIFFIKTIWGNIVCKQICKDLLTSISIVDETPFTLIKEKSEYVLSTNMEKKNFKIMKTIRERNEVLPCSSVFNYKRYQIISNMTSTEGYGVAESMRINRKC